MRKRLARIWIIAIRDYLELLQTKAFWIGVFIVPILLAAFSVIPLLLVEDTETEYAVLDRSGGLAEQIRVEIARIDVRKFLSRLPETHATEDSLFRSVKEYFDAIAENGPEVDSLIEQIAELIALPVGTTLPDTSPSVIGEFADRWRTDPWTISEIADVDSLSQFREVRPTEATQEQLEAMLDAKDIFGFFIIPENLVEKDADAKYITRTLSNISVEDWYSRRATNVLRDIRLKREGLDLDTVERVTAQVDFKEHKHSAGAEAGTEEKADDLDKLLEYVPAIYSYVLWIMIFTSAMALMTNVVEEKSNRLFEVILSSARASELMDGKTLAVLFSGLTMAGVWFVTGFALIQFGIKFSGGSLTGISAAILDPRLMIQFVFFFVTGFLFYAALLSALGASCTTMKEAQALSLPVQLVLFVPLILLLPISMDPDRSIAVALSYVPPLTPFVMMNRAIGTPAAWEYFATGGLMLVTLVFTRMFCIRIYQKGVLASGRAPTFRELTAMLKESDL